MTTSDMKSSGWLAARRKDSLELCVCVRVCFSILGPTTSKQQRQWQEQQHQHTAWLFNRIHILQKNIRHAKCTYLGPETIQKWDSCRWCPLVTLVTRETSHLHSKFKEPCLLTRKTHLQQGNISKFRSHLGKKIWKGPNFAMKSIEPLDFANW